MGKPELELNLHGTIWQFRNPGYRAAYAAHPEIYRPRFGSYHLAAIARGTSVTGHRLFWAPVSERLYLFYESQAPTGSLQTPAARSLLPSENRLPSRVVSSATDRAGQKPKRAAP